MFNGAQVRTSLETDFGGTATAVRNEAASYEVDVKVRVKIPKPHTSLDELAKLNDRLPILLPGLPALLEGAKVSPVWDNLYRLKVSQLQKALNRFDNLLSRHDLFDCETALELQHPTTKRRAVLVQADMDTDGNAPSGSKMTLEASPFFRSKAGSLNSFLKSERFIQPQSPPFDRFMSLLNSLARSSNFSPAFWRARI